MFWLGIALIILGVGLIIGELFIGSGLLLAGGVVALVFGIIFLFTSSLIFQINWYLAGPLIILFIGLVVFVVLKVVRVHQTKIKTGTEDMIGRIAVVKEPLNPEGTVLFEGELWTAISYSGNIQPGEEVIITRVDKLLLTVSKKGK